MFLPSGLSITFSVTGIAFSQLSFQQEATIFLTGQSLGSSVVVPNEDVVVYLD